MKVKKNMQHGNLRLGVSHDSLYVSYVNCYSIILIYGCYKIITMTISIPQNWKEYRDFSMVEENMDVISAAYYKIIEEN